MDFIVKKLNSRMYCLRKLNSFHITPYILNVFYTSTIVSFTVSKEEVMEKMQRMKNGKAVGQDDIPVEVWKCLGESELKFLTKLYNRTMESERMPDEWRDSVLIPIFKNKSDVQSCSNYR